jgi:hypothetical protein
VLNLIGRHPGVVVTAVWLLATGAVSLVLASWLYLVMGVVLAVLAWSITYPVRHRGARIG